jgi:hypothetical protein
MLAGAGGRLNTVAAAALTAATAAAVVAAAAAAAAVPLAALLVASGAADPLACGSPAHINGSLFIVFIIVLLLFIKVIPPYSVSIPLCVKEINRNQTDCKSAYNRILCSLKFILPYSVSIPLCNKEINHTSMC